VTVYLVDNSAWARATKPAVATVLAAHADQDALAICGIAQTEMLRSARSAEEFGRMHAALRALQWLSSPDDIWTRVVEVQMSLARRGHHRGINPVDLAIAATAERHGASVIHYDRDFDTIASVTNQPTIWVVPRGTAD
jgi:predicted nucleic acid-binding protein